ncbi:MAG: hypothetical protein R3C56_04000 [Pirellulaceae bacterium]|jgi:hypothetical protein
MAEIVTQNETEILSRVIAPRDGKLTVEVANSLLSLRFPDCNIDRMNELAEKNGGVKFRRKSAKNWNRIRASAVF